MNEYKCKCYMYKGMQRCSYCDKVASTPNGEHGFRADEIMVHLPSFSMYHNDMLPEDSVIQHGSHLQCGNKAFREIFISMGGTVDQYADYMLRQAKNRFKAWLEREHKLQIIVLDVKFNGMWVQ